MINRPTFRAELAHYRTTAAYRRVVIGELTSAPAKDLRAARAQARKALAALVRAEVEFFDRYELIRLDADDRGLVMAVSA